MLAMRLGEAPYEPDLPLSGRIHADIGPDGMPRMVDGRILVDKGFIVDADDPLTPHSRSTAPKSISNGMRRAARWSMPFQIVSGGNRLTLLAQADAPHEAGRRLGLEDIRRHGRARHRRAGRRRLSSSSTASC